ncbi:MAG: aspartate/glutamate racemase family protein [Thermomicrobiales bacterium]
MSQTIGILGGMGPLATADLYQKIIAATPARRDQDHCHVIIDSDPAIPDRTAALNGSGPDALPGLVVSAQRLVAAGAEFIVIPCNTAHAFLPRLRPHVGVPIVDMIAETAEAVLAEFPQARRIGILAYQGTIATGLYHDALRAHGLEPLSPPAEEQRRLVDAAIEAVKAGDTRPEVGGWLAQAGQALIARGAEVLLAACTEIPIVLHPPMVAAPLLDPTLILARAAVRAARTAPALAAD